MSVEAFRVEDGAFALQSLWRRGVQFDGLVCQSDAQAVGVINELVRQGIRIPDEMKITGVDNSPLAESCIVPLTSVSSGMKIAGKTAVEILMRRLAGEAVESIVLPPLLIVRASTGGPPSA